MNYIILFISCSILSPPLFAQKSFSPPGESLKLFNQYKPKIEQSNNAIVDDPEIFVGDINGDSLDDCLVYFVLTPKDGGNVVIDRQTAIYINTGDSMKVVGAFPSFDFCYVIVQIKKSIIYLREFQCGPGASTFEKQRKYRFRAGKIHEIK